MTADGVDPATFERAKEVIDGSADRWTVDMVIAAIDAATVAFEDQVPTINALNVFPVPDGDTGTNMYLTLKAVCDELDRHSHELPDRVDDLLKIATRGGLMGARGNSGVILYQIIAGICAGVEGADDLHGPTLARGFDFAAEMAYRAVNNPVEGTMLSVIKAVGEACHSYQDSAAPVADVLETAREAAEEAVRLTPDQLPVLRQAGVVDAGGQGLLTIIAGLHAYATGEAPVVERAHDFPHSFASDMHFLDQAEVIHGLEEFGYCINFVVTGEDLEDRGLRQTLDALGTSTVAVGDAAMMKIHTHSEHPGTMLEAALAFGELHEIRIDNMKTQTEQLLAERKAQVAPYQFEPPSELDLKTGIIAVGAGEGIASALKGMGATVVVSGGASMNPSTGEIRDAVQSLGLDEVIILPNDANILASARHAANIDGVDVRVVPTTSIQQGIAALAAFNFDAPLEQNVEAMAEAMHDVRALAVARASRDAQIDDLVFKSGEFMGIRDGKPQITGAEIAPLTIELLASSEADEYELATFFLGEPADEGLAEQLASLIEERFPELEAEFAEGGQPHFDLLISLE